MQLLNTLYVTLPESYLRLDNDTLRVVDEARETRLRVPLHHLQAVVCFGHVGMSAPLMHRLADEGIALVLLDANGRFKARLEGAVSGNVLLRRAQHHAVDNAGFTLEAARCIVAGKLRNQRQVLMRGARENKDEAERSRLVRAARTWPPACAPCPPPPTSTACAGWRAKAHAVISRRSTCSSNPSAARTSRWTAAAAARRATA